MPSEPKELTRATQEPNFANLESDQSAEPTRPVLSAVLIQAMAPAEEAASTEPSAITKPTDEATSSTPEQDEAAKSPIAQLSSEEIALAQDVSAFLKSIAPWKSIMPSELSGRMERLKERTQALESQVVKTDSDEYGGL